MIKDAEMSNTKIEFDLQPITLRWVTATLLCSIKTSVSSFQPGQLYIAPKHSFLPAAEAVARPRRRVA